MPTQSAGRPPSFCPCHHRNRIRGRVLSSERIKIVLAPDSFKGSLDAVGVCRAMEEGIRRVCPSAEIVKIPIADGGEGTAAAWAEAAGGELVRTRVTGPLGAPVDAEFAWMPETRTAVAELASASGLVLVPPEFRNPLETTTFGTGELIRKALDHGATNVIVGLGGSSTTDGGCGAAQALGVRFYRANGTEITEPMNGRLMAEVSRVDLSALDQRLGSVCVTAATDVVNPLLGPKGAVMNYSAQKGANPDQLAFLETAMGCLFDIIETVVQRNVRDLPGAGSAGGCGAGFAAFLSAKIESGIGLLLKASRFTERIAGADLVFTGEGKVDGQTLFGKAVSGVALAAKSQSIPVIVVAGEVASSAEPLYRSGVTSMFSICSGPVSADIAMKNVEPLIAPMVERILRVWLSAGDSRPVNGASQTTAFQGHQSIHQGETP